jgi:hypothetical protein
MRKLKQGLEEQLRRRKCKLRNHMTLEVEQFKKRTYNHRNHKT